MAITTTAKLLIFAIVTFQTKAQHCPPTEDIADLIWPCECLESQTESNLTTFSLSCINFDANQTIQLAEIFTNFSQYLNQTDNFNQFAELFVSNSKLELFDRNTFGKLKFRHLEIHETNLTSLESDTFLNMADSLETILIRGDRLGYGFFDAIKPVTSLRELTLNLGLHSMKTIYPDALTNMPNLQRVVLNGIAQKLKANAFSQLPALKSIKVNNQLDEIESFAFNLTETGLGSMLISIDLSGNRLDETSFGMDFIQTDANSVVELDLSHNLIRTLPESIFRNFFQLNRSNKLRMNRNQFLCGHCDSYWIVADSLLTSDRIEISCYQNELVSIWNYDWTGCKSASATMNLSRSALLIVMLIALLWVI